MIRKGYYGKAGAQLHYRSVDKYESKKTPLMCLSPAPHSSVFFETFMTLMAHDRQVIAPDYPGYGGSDPLEAEVSVEAYAERISSDFDDSTEIDLLGFHSGNFVAAEVMRLHPNKVRRVIMIDLPFFPEETRKKYAAHFSKNEWPKDIQASFEKSVVNHEESVEFERAYNLWVENLRSGLHRNDTFQAAFAYPYVERLAILKHHITVIATDSPLLKPSREAAKIIPNANYIERLDIKAPVFDSHGEVIVKIINETEDGKG